MKDVINEYVEISQKVDYYWNLKVLARKKLKKELFKYFNQDGEVYSEIIINDDPCGLIITLKGKKNE